MYRRRDQIQEDDQMSISPFFTASRRCKKLSPTWNLKIFDIEKKSLALNEASSLFGSIVTQINSLGKPAGQLPFNLLTHEVILNNKPENLKVVCKDEISKNSDKGKETDQKGLKKFDGTKKISEALTARIHAKDEGLAEEKLAASEKNLFKAVKRNKKATDVQNKINTNNDIAEMLYGNLKELYRRVNKKSEESRRLAETTSLISLQTRQKIENLESKVAKIKMDLINPTYKSAQLLKESILKPKRESIFPKIYN